MKLKDQQKILQKQWRDVISQYMEILNAIVPKDLQEVEEERRNILYGGLKITGKEESQREKVYSGATSKRVTMQRALPFSTAKE